MVEPEIIHVLFMKKIIVSAVFICSCQAELPNDPYTSFFTETDQTLIESIELTPSSKDDIFILNQDSTYTKIENSSTFSVGEIEPKGDSLFFHSKNMTDQNLFLHYELKEEHAKHLTIKSYDKTGKPIENLEVILISDQQRDTSHSRQGQFSIPHNLYDTIVFPQLEKLTARKHRLPLSSRKNLMLYFDINQEILQPKVTDFRYQPHEIFVLFHSFDEMFNHNLTK